MFFVEKETPKIKKKNEKSLSFFGLHFLVARGATREEKKAMSSLPNYFSSGPSVVEEDLEDLHHHMVMFKKETTIS